MWIYILILINHGYTYQVESALASDRFDDPTYTSQEIGGKRFTTAAMAIEN